jgi:NifU-like protein involved in Fe-S cluster formation
VRNFKSRHECVLLPFEALAQALDEATDAQGQ